MTAFFATVARGLETLAAEELEALGASSVTPGFCGVGFEGDRALLYKVNLWARLPFRILVKLGEFSCEDADDLYRVVQQIDWQPHLTPFQTLAVHATGQLTGKGRRLNHSHFTALQVKNAIVDQQQAQLGERSSVDPQEPDVAVNVHIYRDRCTVSLDSSGGSLHRRGYRPAVGVAPLKESLAAALIRLSGWQSDQAFYDPFCGSGTLPLEASQQALQIAPGLFRDRFGFETWPDFDVVLWEQLLEAAKASRQTELKAFVGGSDRDSERINQAEDNARFCGVESQVQFFPTDLSEIVPPAASGILLCNPPYGFRIDEGEDLGALYKQLGDVLKQRFSGWTAFVLSGNKQLIQQIGLRSSQRIPIYNGSIECRLVKYELY